MQKNEKLFLYLIGDQTKTGWSNIRLKKLGCVSECYCLNFSGWPREALHVTKTKTTRNCELNTSDDFMSLRTEEQKISLWTNVLVTYIHCE